MTRSSLKQQREQKGDEKPQQQKKRKNNNPFVFPEKKIPAVDKTPYIFRTPIDLMTGSRTVRCFTPEEREAYLKKLKETEAKKDGKAYSPCNFQALVRNSGRMHIEFCREEKKPKLTEGPGRHLSNDERLTSL
ncbi:hypothetical protein RHSIM_Rhsim07G0120000 [Rhododendron simsii]|uniref:Uncharacterized protein n=1 Tax=Rhododendron simsii TaxID=118357 RepID=A0A834LIS4_RHOSS|nr:hypothetical protein RHSIM_Rhsim07G0120000 [Rhododendron simsii]